MGFDRFSAKLSARESMRVNRPSPVLVTLVYFLLTVAVSLVVLFLTSAPAVAFYEYISVGYYAEEAVQYILRDQGGSLIAFAAVWLLLGLYRFYMSVGYISYTLRMARNEQPGISNLFDGFARPVRVLGAYLLISLFTVLWTLAVLLPLCAVLLLGEVAPQDGAYIIGNVTSVASMVISYRYSLTYYFIIDDPNCTAWQAIRRSKNTMRGWKWSLFCLDLSFLGWELLALMIGVIFSVTAMYGTLLFLNGYSILIMIGAALVGATLIDVWLTPYAGAARANFYDSVTGAVQPSGDPAGPDYDYRSGDGSDRL